MANKHNGASGRCWRSDDFAQIDTDRNRDIYEVIVQKIRACTCEVCNKALTTYEEEKKRRSVHVA
jgi:hypothetical protein